MVFSVDHQISSNIKVDDKVNKKVRINNFTNEVKTKKLKKPKIKKEVPKKKTEYSCEFCNEIFTRKDRLDRHMFAHTGKVRKKYFFH